MLPFYGQRGLLRAFRALLWMAVIFARVAGAAAQGEPGRGAQPVFEFHSGFWINLHHFLYQQARLRDAQTGGPAGANETYAAPKGERDAGARAGSSARVSTASLSPEERKAWAEAVDYYAGALADRDLLFNGDMVNINNRLAELETCTELAGQTARACASGLRPEQVIALERFAPVYRAHWWPEHDRGNRAWIAAVGPRVRQMGAALARQLAAVYRAEWLAGRIRVDLVSYGGPFGAYTTLDPLHVTISSGDPRNQGPAALEVLFHEASHALARQVSDAIVRECRQRGKAIPRDLWHALLFYTTGEMVRRALVAERAAAGGAMGRDSDEYTPYAYRYGLFARGWSGYQRLLERHWQPYLDGKIDFDTAIARLVSGL